MSGLDNFLQACAGEIDRRAELAVGDRAALREGARSFQAAVAASKPLTRALAVVPVAGHLADIDDSPLAQLFGAAANEVPWIASYRMTDQGTEAALAPLEQVRDLGDLTVGLMLLGPGCSYPEHSHAPQELYLPITSGGSWRYGGRPDYRDVADDGLIYNNPNDLHGAHAPPTRPLLALYVLWP